MKRLIKVLNLLVEKYIDNCDIIVDRDLLTLEYHTYKNGEIDVFNTLQIIEFKDKFKVKFVKEKFTKIVELNEFENIMDILKHQEKYKMPSKNEVEFINKDYPIGTKIKLEKLYDLVNIISKDTTGLITGFSDKGALIVAWDNGKVSELCVGRDVFSIVGEKDG